MQNFKRTCCCWLDMADDCNQSDQASNLLHFEKTQNLTGPAI